MKLTTILLAGAAMMAASAAQAQSVETIDFSTYANGTPVTTVGNATFSLQGGPGTGTPVTGSFGSASLGNSPTGDYPTAQVLDVAFAKSVSNLAFTFNNFGDNNQFGQPSTATAYDAMGAVLGTINVGTGDYSNFFAPGSFLVNGITDLKFDNGTNGNSNWEFGLQSLTYTVNAASTTPGAVPEPATWAMMMLGFGMIGFGLRRRSKVTTSVRFA